MYFRRWLQWKNFFKRGTRRHDETKPNKTVGDTSSVRPRGRGTGTPKDSGENVTGRTRDLGCRRRTKCEGKTLRVGDYRRSFQRTLHVKTLERIDL